MDEFRAYFMKRGSSVSAKKSGNTSIRIQKPTNKPPTKDVNSQRIILLQEHRNGGFVAADG